jgi:2-oxoglutarate/2-oxoacid ferredoxin oxidoreductase subunit alpha
MKQMWKGNHAIAEGALRGGLQFYAGYPITPQTEVLEYLSYRMSELDRIFVQAENEIAAISMVYGASATGLRSMTGSSGPGMSLKQEGISYLCYNDLPCVIVNVQRWGAALGTLDSSQTDYLRDTRGGGHGDYRLIIYAPNSIQETVDLLYFAFEKAEQYRNPVEIYSEASLGQMMEPCEMPEFKERGCDLEWSWDGTNRDHKKVMKPDKPAHHTAKYTKIIENEQRWESYQTEDAEHIFVSLGLPSRVAKDAIKRLRAEGEKVGLIRPITIWPYPMKAFAELQENVKGFLSIESTDMGMHVEDVALAAKKGCKENVPVYLLATNQHIPKVKEVMAVYQQMKNGELKEKF